MQPNGSGRLHLLNSFRPNPLAFALGRPRAILDVGGALRHEPALRGARVRPDMTCEVDLAAGYDSAFAAIAGRRFDLVVVAAASALAPEGGSTDQLFERLSPFLEREGHVLVVGARDPALAVAASRAELAILREEEGFFVARRPPPAGPLTFTVGMLTMNEEESIEKMIHEIRRVAPDAAILCVDSSTKDQTPVIAERLGARVLRQLPPRGHGPAMELLMYEAARQSDALIYLDCDFTYPVDAIPAIRRLLESGVDVVNAARTRKKPDAMPLPNYLANRAFALASQALHGVPAADLHSGMRGYRSSVIHAFAFDGEGDALPIDTLLFPAKCGYQVVEIPIPYSERVGASKLRKLAGTAWTFVRIGKALAVGKRNRYHYDVRESLE